MQDNAGGLAHDVTICGLTSIIENLISDYRGYKFTISSLPYIQTYPADFLKEHCPDAQSLEASFLVTTLEDETFLGIHLSQNISTILSGYNRLDELLKNPEGLNAFLILTEEISHFHYYIHMTQIGRPISLFDLEVQAELDKIVVTSLVMKTMFGQTHIRELVLLLFNQSTVTGHLTDYQLASRIAERFWKSHLSDFGPLMLFDPRMRAHLNRIFMATGEEKRQILQTNIRAA
jgi:hypothetical protein